MAYKDPEQQRIKQHEYYIANREKIKERVRVYRAQNLDKIREHDRERSRQEHRLAANRDYYARNQDRIQPKDQQRRKRDHHGLWPEDWVALWNEQDECCYLCGEELILEEAHVDHDHSCCRKGFSCPTCRRGLAHRVCNIMIGMADDDPAKLRRLAGALEAAQLAFRQRKDAIGEQLALSG